MSGFLMICGVRGPMGNNGDAPPCPCLTRQFARSITSRQRREQQILHCVQVWKKTKRKFTGESDVYLESKSDDMDLPLSAQFGDCSGSASGTKKKEKLPGQVNYSGVEPWSFEHHIGEAIFIPAGCPFQARHIQSSVQLGLDFLSLESLPESVRLSEEIRGLPNDHEAKLQMLEVGKISLYAASSAIREVQKIVFDPKLGPELGFEDRKLTAYRSLVLETF